jgi:hypothetical protein
MTSPATEPRLIMTLLREKMPPTTAILLVAIFILLFLGSGLGLAYLGGVFTDKNEVLANDQRIMNEEAQAALKDQKEKTGDMGH